MTRRVNDVKARTLEVLLEGLPGEARGEVRASPARRDQKQSLSLARVQAQRGARRQEVKKGRELISSFQNSRLDFAVPLAYLHFNSLMRLYIAIVTFFSDRISDVIEQ